MKFGFLFSNDTGEKMLSPLGKCYVLYKKITFVDKGIFKSDVILDVSINNDPPPCVFVVSSSPPKDSNRGYYSSGYCVLGGKTVGGDIKYCLECSNVTGVLYMFMPADWVEIKVNEKYKFGIRIYNELGEVSYMGTKKPLNIAGQFILKKNKPTESIQISSDDIAVLVGVNGYTNGWVYSQPVDYMISRTAYKGRMYTLGDDVGSETYIPCATQLPIPYIKVGYYR